MPRELKTRLVADARPFNNTLDAAANKVTGFSNRLKAMGGGSLGKGIAVGAGIASFNLLTSAVDAAIGKMDEAHQAYLADQASQERLQNVLKNTEKDYLAASAAAEKFANAQIDLGFQDDDVRDSLGKLRGVTKDLAEAQKLVQLAMDISRAKNKTLEESTLAVIQAVNGQARGLRSLGIETAGAAGATQLLAAAENNVRNAAVNYAKSAPGAVSKANAKMAETMERVGLAIDKVSQVIIPVMLTGLSTLVDIAGNVIGVFMKIAEVLQNNFGPQMEAAAQLVRNALTPFAVLNDIINNISGALGNLGGGGQSADTNPNGTPLPKGVTVTKYPGGFGGSFASGGVVPGPAGSPTMILAHGGETVTPQGRAAAQVININIASFIGSDRDIDRFADRLAFRLRATSLS